jgi:hypothetical protein
MSFYDFYSSVRGKLEKRATGFDYIFDYLKQIKNPVIVETGCARQENNYGGDGQSSILFDRFIHDHGGEFHTIDISEENVNFCKRKILSSNSQIYLNDSITQLKILNDEFQKENKKIDFLYLDSFDASTIDTHITAKSALHHLYEFITILPSLNSDALIGVDDNWYEIHDNNTLLEGSVCGGKGQFIFDYMKRIGNNPCYNGYQIIWKY